MNSFYSFTRFVGKLLFSLCYSHKTFGIAHIPKGKAIIAPNHVSFLDPPIIGVSCSEELHYLAKDVLFKTWLGPFIRRLNAFPVSGNVSNLTTIKSLVSLLRAGHKIIIFPEGIRTFDGKLASIKPGIALVALRANAPIVPAYLHGTYEIWPRTKSYPKLQGKTACVFGSPISPEKFQHLDKKLAQAALTEEIKIAIGNLREWYLAGAAGTPP